MKKMKVFKKMEFTKVVNKLVNNNISKLEIGRQLKYPNPLSIYRLIKNNKTKSIRLHKKKIRYWNKLVKSVTNII